MAIHLCVGMLKSPKRAFQFALVCVGFASGVTFCDKSIGDNKHTPNVASSELILWDFQVNDAKKSIERFALATVTQWRKQHEGLHGVSFDHTHHSQPFRLARFAKDQVLTETGDLRWPH